MLVGEFTMVQNVPQEIRDGYALENAKLGLPAFRRTDKPIDGVAVIVAGGPSLAESIEEIRARKLNGAMIWTMNNTYAYLLGERIQADAHVFLDSRKENDEFLIPSADVTYYLDIRCNPSLYERASGCRIITYDLDRAATGPTVGLKALYLAAMSGYRDLHLYGFDSSYRSGAHHAYAQALNDNENRCEITVNGRTFDCAPWMAKQADEFQHIAASLAEQDCVISVHGDGLLPHVARIMSQPAEEPYYL